MSVVVNTKRLRLELVHRGWTAAALAHEAQLSPATISAALGGRPITVTSVRLIAQALARAPAVDGIELLLGE